MNSIRNNQTVWYRGKPIGNVEICQDTDKPDAGKAIIDGRTRQVIFRKTTRGTFKGTMQWHCDDM